MKEKLYDPGSGKKKKHLKSLRNSVIGHGYIPFFLREQLAEKRFKGFVDPIRNNDLLLDIRANIPNGGDKTIKGFFEDDLALHITSYNKKIIDDIENLVRDVLGDGYFKRMEDDSRRIYAFSGFCDCPNVDMALLNFTGFVSAHRPTKDKSYLDKLPSLENALYILLKKTTDKYGHFSQHCLIVPLGNKDPWLKLFLRDRHVTFKKKIRRTNAYFYNNIYAGDASAYESMKLYYYDGYFSRSTFIRGLKQAIELKGDWKRDY